MPPDGREMIKIIVTITHTGIQVWKGKNKVVKKARTIKTQSLFTVL